MTGVMLIVVFSLAALWLSLVLVERAIEHAPREETKWALAWLFVCLYARLIHRVRVEGRENIPRWTPGDPPVGPLVIVANHTSGIDPLLVHSACPFDIRWMMMREMMLAPFARIWEWLEIIPVEQTGRDSTALRTAIRHLQGGGALGIFAEGGLERPPGVVMPYLPGVGLLVLKSKADVLPVVISGTPRVAHAYSSLFMPSRARIRFLPIRRYDASGLNAADIARRLEEEAARELGWARAGAPEQRPVAAA